MVLLGKIVQKYKLALLSKHACVQKNANQNNSKVYLEIKKSARQRLYESVHLEFI